MTEKDNIIEKRYQNQGSTFRGYFLPTNSIVPSMIGIFGALTCVVTMMIAFPIPATNGFINIGDAMVMLTGLLFGPIVGAIAGGVGSAMADIFLGYTIYAPATLVIKGLEGFLVGLIANPKDNYSKLNYRDVIGVVAGGVLMAFGYLIYEIMLYGVPGALYEFILNGIIQFGLGAIIALAIIMGTRNNMVVNLPQVFDKVFISKE